MDVQVRPILQNMNEASVVVYFVLLLPMIFPVVHLESRVRDEHF